MGYSHDRLIPSEHSAAMAELLGAVQDTPIPNLLVLAGIVFIFLAIAGGLTDKVTVPKERQRLIGGIGAVLLVTGIGLHVLDNQRPPSGDAKATPAPTQLAIVTAPAAAQATATGVAVVPVSTQAATAPAVTPPTAFVTATVPFSETVGAGPALPGTETIPLTTLAASIPWLPLDSNAIPGSYFYLFNVSTSPFDDVRLRKAFVLALDRQALSTLANSLSNQTRPATTFTPPETLGRDLYGQVGLSFDPTAAATLLAEAGYPNGEDFPPFKLLLAADATNEALANAAVSMWRANLGVEPEVEILDLEDDEFFERVAADPGNITVLGWLADYNDPDNFLYAAFNSQSDQRVGNFANASFDQLVRRAAALSSDPPARQRLYIEAERLLAQQAALLPVYHFTSVP